MVSFNFIYAKFDFKKMEILTLLFEEEWLKVLTPSP